MSFETKPKTKKFKFSAKQANLLLRNFIDIDDTVKIIVLNSTSDDMVAKTLEKKGVGTFIDTKNGYSKNGFHIHENLDGDDDFRNTIIKIALKKVNK